MDERTALKPDQNTTKFTAIVTGGNSGLGLQCAKSIAASKDWYVIIACRNQQTAADALAQLRNDTRSCGEHNNAVECMALDLGSLASVRAFAEEFARRKMQLPPLRALVLNAGVQSMRGDKSADGFEETFGVNHLGHFLFAHLLSLHLQHPSRIVFVASGTHDPAQTTGMPPPIYTNARALAFAQPAGDLGAFGRQAYTNSKLCNVLCAYEFARRAKAAGVAMSVVAFDPGLMPGTGLAREYSAFARFAWNWLLPVATVIPGVNIHTAGQSGAALAAIAVDPAFQGQSGKYFIGRQEAPSSQDSYDVAKALDLWSTSVELVHLRADEHVL